jgi:DNA-binding NarL/FixJ family response regulator
MADGSRVPGCIVLSNHSTPEMRAKCLELGAIEVFDKSNELDEMLAWIKRFSKIGRAAAASRS